MSVIDTTTSNQIGESFASLSELKHEHVALLQVVRASPREAKADLINGFIKRAQATGNRLDELSERDAAQSILDYWTTVLIHLCNGAGDLPAAPTLAEYDLSQADDLAGRPSPFKGLSAFGETDADWFFGREDAIKLLIEVVTREPLTMVAGPSGSGKSSLVLAGLLPYLKRGHCLAARTGVTSQLSRRAATLCCPCCR
jgi:hypothetical protein